MLTHKLANDTNRGPILYWRIIIEEGAVKLQASRDNDDWWYVVKIEPDGRLVRHLAVPIELGLLLESNGRIVEDKRSTA